jgi:hypothetical protein
LNGVEIIVFTFEQSIRVEVVTYRLDVGFGSQHMQQLHGFDKLSRDQLIIRNRRTTIETIALSLFLSAPYFSFRFLPLAEIIDQIENGKNRVFQKLSSKIWTSTTRKNNFYVNCMAASRDFSSGDFLF